MHGRRVATNQEMSKEKTPRQHATLSVSGVKTDFLMEGTKVYIRAIL